MTDLRLARHDCVLCAGGGDLLVLWVGPGGHPVALIDRGAPDSWPFLVSAGDIVARVDAGEWVVKVGTPPRQRLDFELPEGSRERRDRLHAVVRSIVDEHAPDVFTTRARGRLVTAAMAAHGLSRPTVLEALRRYFQGGMVVDALVPHFDRCGAPGVSRLALPDSPKVGRPRPPGHPVGVNVTDDIARYFRLAVKMSYARDRRHDKASAYRFCIREFFSVGEVDPATGRISYHPDPSYVGPGLPSQGQFNYWFDKDQQVAYLGRRREGARRWEMRHRGLTSTAQSQTLGHGLRYEIDATVLNVYVRARHRRRRLVARPTLYLVVDVWSRMIVGIHVTLEHPSWIAAAMALANAVEDKVSFCARFGVPIGEEDWPAHHICATVLGDKGEMAKSGVEGILTAFDVRVENAASYRADWKPVVEQNFGTLDALYQPYVDGYVQEDFGERGSRDYRDDAVLDIDDVTRIIIEAVLYHNNKHELVDLPKYPHQTDDGVPSVPIELWEWGIANLSGSPRIPDPDRFRFALMPRAEASVTPYGIYFQKRYYTCAKGREEGWFEAARDGRSTKSISYNKGDVDRIYVHDRTEGLGFVVAELTVDRSAQYRGLTGWECHALDADADLISAGRRDASLLARVSMEARVATINDRAREALPPRPVGVSAAAERHGMREARAEEVARDRVVDARAFRPGDDRSDASDAVAGPVPDVGGGVLPSVVDFRGARKRRKS